jgi:hypothetical protein
MGQFLSFSCTAEPSEDGEIFDSDDEDLPSLRKIIARPKQVIDLTFDDDDDSEAAAMATTTTILPR